MELIGRHYGTRMYIWYVPHTIGTFIVCRDTVLDWTSGICGALCGSRSVSLISSVPALTPALVSLLECLLDRVASGAHGTHPQLKEHQLTLPLDVESTDGKCTQVQVHSYFSRAMML